MARGIWIKPRVSKCRLAARCLCTMASYKQVVGFVLLSAVTALRPNEMQNSHLNELEMEKNNHSDLELGGGSQV
eukprot:Skav222500  [mRNA]  locus=scaffold1835:705477:706494:- [translate_table: standard]